MNIRISLVAASAAFAIASCAPRVMQMPAPRETRTERTDRTDNRLVATRQNVLIGLRVDIEKAVIQGATGFAVKAANSVETWKGGPHTVTASGGRIHINGEPVGGQTRLSPIGSDDGLDLGGKHYRGSLILRPTGGAKFTVINELAIDDYLKGVLPREVVETWPEETLRVQAVASRTYLASHLGRHKDQGYDLCADVHCQVYGGTSRETPKCSAAVDATRGEILVHDNAAISAYFHSNCGGMTEQVQYVWGLNPKRYLVRKRCGFGTKDPRYNWTWSLDDKSILAALRKGTKVQGTVLKKVEIVKKSPSGRAETIRVVTDKGVYRMKSNDFRIALHPEKVRSTYWTSFSHRGGHVKIRGTGWGHGVGMCQWGAKGQAEDGRTYREILSFYYPHAELQLWNRL